MSVVDVDLRFVDLKGTWRHLTIPASALSERDVYQGVPFDGSSLEGWCAIDNSDMLLKLQLDETLSRVFLDPFSIHPTAVVICTIEDPSTGLAYSRDPRTVALKAERYLRDSQIADVAYFGPELEFFIFDQVDFEASPYRSTYKLKSAEFSKNPYRFSSKKAYFSGHPSDKDADIRSEIAKTLLDIGLDVERHHHEVALGQHEIGVKYAGLTESADHVLMQKYVVRGMADRYGKAATFMPKPIRGDNGSGMHVHQSLWKDEIALFAGSGYAGLSDMARHYIAGILTHAKSLNAFTNPSTNSYKRLVPGFEAPVLCTYSSRNRSAACRIPHFFSPEGARIEIRFPDPTANPYLAFSALLMAGLDGIKRRLEPGEPAQGDLFETGGEKYPTVCGSLEEALTALSDDHAYLLEGDVFTKDLIHSYLNIKREELTEYTQSPHPIEFVTSFGA